MSLFCRVSCALFSPALLALDLFFCVQILIDSMSMVWSEHWLPNVCKVLWGFCCLFCFSLDTHLEGLVQFSGLTLIYKPFWKLLLITGLQMDAVISDSVCEGEMKREMIGMLQLLPWDSRCAHRIKHGCKKKNSVSSEIVALWHFWQEPWLSVS